jgi:hypothetical protein
MPLTKSFNTTVKEQLQKSEEFRRALLREAVGCMLTGDLETGKSVLRKYINGTVGFVKLGADLGKSPKVLMRMFGPTGNPQGGICLRLWRICRRLRERCWKLWIGRRRERHQSLIAGAFVLQPTVGDHPPVHL